MQRYNENFKIMFNLRFLMFKMREFMDFRLKITDFKHYFTLYLHFFHHLGRLFQKNNLILHNN